MRGNQIAASAALLGFVVTFAALGQARAAAQQESEHYYDSWSKPFCMQPAWDEAKWEYQNMRWDIKVDSRQDVSPGHQSVAWHDSWSKPFNMQPYWDEQRWEDRNMRWDIKLDKPIDLSAEPHSAYWWDSWSKPFCMQPPWDEQRWEEHCIFGDKPAGYRHTESSEMDYRSE